MVYECLDEYLHVVNYCITTEKKNTDLMCFPHHPIGILGYPAVNLLFSIVDIIGSYMDGQKIKLKDQNVKIRHSIVVSHYYALCSKFFNQELTKGNIEDLYKIARSPLVHNGSIGAEATLHPGRSSSNRFIKFDEKANGKGRYIIYVSSFYDECKKAVEAFKKEPELIATSKNGRFKKLKQI